MKIAIYQFLESFFEALEMLAGRVRERFSICPRCRQNRYTGEPCVDWVLTYTEVRW
jgi:hypothetical protein